MISAMTTTRCRSEPMRETDWHKHWRDYRGPVRAVLDDLSIIHGDAVDTDDDRGVLVRVGDVATWHPAARVWPARWRYEAAS